MLMEEGCKVCQKWQSHVYWSHMDPKNAKFFVQMKTSFTQNLALPRKFARNFKGQISEIVKLKGPSGKTWRMEALKSDDTLSLQSGWSDFVSANKIDENNFLVFKYSGLSSFDVSIFDQSGCEKAAPFFVKDVETVSESEKASSDSDTSVRVFIPPEKKISSDCEISSRAICAKKEREMNANGVSGPANKKAKKEPFDLPYFVPKNFKPSVAQQKIIDEMAAIATQPGSKLLVKILCPTDISWYLLIPACFADENIGKTSQSISLMLANKEKVLPARYVYQEKRQLIGCGWKEFVTEYNLKEGDLCLFEVKKLDDVLTFVVHVPPRANVRAIDFT